ncbi:hypothetical protein ACJIZ3_025584 [Penstemon smallii]|uniref:Uncharacterized protein n=1 Tax=Penstemon smallii TaxID=265156 RepID=A0ABD3TYC8_9LAMI
MASNSSYETSWADQWDPEPLHNNPTTNSSNSKFSDKTKTAASTGVRKVKAGFQWIKQKYQQNKTTNKH